MKATLSTRNRWNFVPIIKKALIAPIGLNVSLVILLVMFGSQQDTDISHLFRDPAAVAGLPYYTGAFSNLGVLLWCATATLCLFGSFILNSIPKQSKMSQFLLASGLLSALLTLDDVFLFHEPDGFLPTVMHIPEKGVYLIYLCLTAGYVVKFHRIIIQNTNYSVLMVAFIAFFLSMGLDKVPESLVPISPQVSNFLEDGMKLVGIVSWFAYFLNICLQVPSWINLKFTVKDL